MVLAGHRKADLIVRFTEFSDRFLIAGFLVSEIITGHANYYQTTLLVIHPNTLQLLILRCVSAFRRRIDKKYGLPPIIGQRHAVALKTHKYKFKNIHVNTPG
jgi:hypothetical protein